MKKLLTTTAVLMSLSGMAFAASHKAEETEEMNASDSATMSESTTEMSEDTTMAKDTEMSNMSGFGNVMASKEDFFASDLIGMRIYNVEADMDTTVTVADNAEQEWDDIGEINDLIVSSDGQVTAVILGVGGFLGLGERDVSVSMDAITVVMEEGDSDDRFLVVKTSKEELEAAPEFEREDD